MDVKDAQVGVDTEASDNKAIKASEVYREHPDLGVVGLERPVYKVTKDAKVPMVLQEQPAQRVPQELLAQRGHKVDRASQVLFQAS